MVEAALKVFVFADATGWVIAGVILRDIGWVCGTKIIKKPLPGGERTVL
jgi:hypothetical protein